MKKIITLCAVFLMTATVFAQSPNKMSYQAVIRNNLNALVTNSALSMRISILQTSASGTAVYVETQTPTTNTNGLVSIEIGGGIVVLGNFANINWTNGPYFVKTETDPLGGTNYSITGTSQLLSVPYALYAATAGNNTPGPQGPAGTDGATGPQGPAGADGATGPQGPAGTGCFTHYIGEEFGGGVIFHLWKDAQGVEHGLIVDKINLSNSQVWSSVNTLLIGSNAQSMWDGLLNSNAIVNQHGVTGSSAAAICLNSTNGGQNDWYLPAIQELNLLWNNYYQVSKSLSQINGATQLFSSPASLLNGYYFSSTEYDSNDAWYFSFLEGVPKYGPNGVKPDPLSVRAIRAF